MGTTNIRAAGAARRCVARGLAAGGILAALALASGAKVPEGAHATQEVLVAYIGPGAGLAAIGALLAVGFGMFTTLVGLIWYPFRQARRWWNARRERNAGLDGRRRGEGRASATTD